MADLDPKDTATVAEIISSGQALQAAHDGHLCRFDNAWHRAEDTWDEHDCQVCSICEIYRCEGGEE